MNLLDFFKKQPSGPNINWVGFTNPDWNQTQREPNCIKWHSPDGASAVSLNFFEKQPDISVPLSDIDGLRDQYRQAIVNMNGGLLKLDVGSVQNIPLVELILKLPMEPRGICYIGSFTIPFRDYSFVIKIDSVESGVTGIRDSAILSKSMSSGKVTTDDKGLVGWFADPYDSIFDGGLLMNLSEREEHDIKFPTHPLSIVRSKLSFIKQSISFNKGIFSLDPFSGN